jgi:hypothetical protein
MPIAHGVETDVIERASLAGSGCIFSQDCATLIDLRGGGVRLLLLKIHNSKYEKN